MPIKKQDRISALVLASGNRGKIAELTALLAPYSVVIHSLAEFSRETPAETGTTFRENALIKARFAAAAAKLPALADDSGIEVDALGGAPGVYSARYAGVDASDDDNNKKLLDALKNIPEEKRTARFRSVLVYVRGCNEPIFAEGVWEGRVIDLPRGTHGFGYDPLFVPFGGTVTSAELSRADKNRVSHRARALAVLLNALIDAGEIA